MTTSQVNGENIQAMSPLRWGVGKTAPAHAEDDMVSPRRKVLMHTSRAWRKQ